MRLRFAEMRSLDHVTQCAPHPDFSAPISGIRLGHTSRGSAGTSRRRRARNGGAAYIRSTHGGTSNVRSTHGRAPNGCAPLRGTGASFRRASYGRRAPFRCTACVSAFRGPARLGAAQLRARRAALRLAAHGAPSCVRSCADPTWRTAFGKDDIRSSAAHRRGTCRSAVQSSGHLSRALRAPRRCRCAAGTGRDQGGTTTSRSGHRPTRDLRRASERGPGPDRRTWPSGAQPRAPRANQTRPHPPESGVRQPGFGPDAGNSGAIDLPRPLHAIELGAGLATSSPSPLRRARFHRPCILALRL